MVRRPVQRAGETATPASSAAAPAAPVGLESTDSRHRNLPAWIHFAYAGYPVAKELAIGYTGMMSTAEPPAPKPPSLVNPPPSLLEEINQRNMYHESRKKDAYPYTIFDSPSFFPFPLCHNRYKLPHLLDFQLAYREELSRAKDLEFSEIIRDQKHRIRVHHMPLEGTPPFLYNYVVTRDYRKGREGFAPSPTPERVELRRLGLVEALEMGERLRDSMLSEAADWAESGVAPLSNLVEFTREVNYLKFHTKLIGHTINLLYFMTFQATTKYVDFPEEPEVDISGCSLIEGKLPLPPMVQDQLNVWLSRQIILRQRIFDEWFTKLAELDVGINSWAALFLVVVSLAYTYDRILASRFEEAKSDKRMLKAYVTYLNHAERTMSSLIRKYRVALGLIPNRHERLPLTAYKPTLGVLETIQRKDTSVFSERVLRWTLPLTDIDMARLYVSPDAVDAELVEDLEKLSI